MSNAIKTASIVMVAVGIGWIITVGTAWLLQYLVNITFGTAFDFNVWAAGTLLFVILFLIKNNA